MGKPTGFLDYQRKDIAYRPVEKRLKDYKDVNQYLPFDEIKIQAARCMDCGIPFCHSLGCPVYNLIPEWNDLVYKGKWEEALGRLEKTNSLPEITGRVCPAPCETSCTLSINDSPVSIKQIELSIIEYGFKNGLVRAKVPEKETKKKVAIIGSGPAGLSCAMALREMGHSVTVYEKEDKAGGILRYGIPDFKLEKWVLDRRIDLMKRSGIKFKTGINTGIKLTAKALKRSYDAILISTGAGEPRKLNVPGCEMKGLYLAMEYLTKSNKYVSGKLKKTEIILAKGKNVLVIGGGDTGSDCVGTANRQGAKKVYQFEILPKPKEWNEPWNPVWPNWPVILRTSSSHKEGAERDWSIIVKCFNSEKGNIKEAVCARADWKCDEKGKFVMSEVPGSEFRLQVELVLLAMGFVHCEHSKLIKDLGLELDGNCNIKTGSDHATSLKGVFAAGDADTGASLVVRAIYHGQEAAKSINKYLSK
ncbi:MAG: glutamate synthase subunit beta [Elusimicrobia bacterium]|nr:glutamate synthase subunit beta [Candidatus Liberimonas magnetica]